MIFFPPLRFQITLCCNSEMKISCVSLLHLSDHRCLYEVASSWYSTLPHLKIVDDVNVFLLESATKHCHCSQFSDVNILLFFFAPKQAMISEINISFQFRHCTKKLLILIFYNGVNFFSGLTYCQCLYSEGRSAIFFPSLVKSMGFLFFHDPLKALII